MTAPCLPPLASNVSALPAPPGRPEGGYDFVHTRGWYSSDTINSRTEASRVIVEEQYLIWRAADGSGRLTTIDADGGESASKMPAGGLTATLPEPMPTTIDVIEAELGKVSPRENGPHWVIRGVSDVYQRQVPPPAVRAALLELLSVSPGVVCAGAAKDRNGRTGTAVYVDHDEVRHWMLFDHQGWLIAEEEKHLTAPRGFPKDAPRVRSYVLYLTHTYTPTLDAPEIPL